MAQVPRNVDFVTLTHLHGGASGKEGEPELNPPGAFASWEGHEELIDRPVTATDIMRYRSKKAKALSQPDAYMGTYREPAGVRQRDPERTGDETFLDVSRRFVGPGRVDRARAFAREQAQISFYDTDAGLKYVHENWAVPPADKYIYSARMRGAAQIQKQARKLPPGEVRTGRINEMLAAIDSAQGLKDPAVVAGVESANAEAVAAQRNARALPPQDAATFSPEQLREIERMVDAVDRADKLKYK